MSQQEFAKGIVAHRIIQRFEGDLAGKTLSLVSTSARGEVRVFAKFRLG